MAKKIKINRTKTKKDLLEIWSMVVRAREHNRCEICGARGVMNAHHIRTKKFMSTAYDLKNGVCLCPTHHRWSNEIAPHSDNCQAVENWLKWLSESKHAEYYLYSKTVKESTIYDSWLLEKKQELLAILGELLGIEKPTISACSKKFKEKYYK